MKQLLSCTKKCCMYERCRFRVENTIDHTIDLNLQTTVNKIEKFQPLEDNLKVLGIDWHKQDDSFVIDLSKSYEAGIELPTTCSKL